MIRCIVSPNRRLLRAAPPQPWRNQRRFSGTETENIGTCVCYSDLGIICDDCVDSYQDHCGECNGNGVDVDFNDLTNDECAALNGTWHFRDQYTIDDNDTPDNLDDDIIVAPCGDGICDGSDTNGDGLCDRDDYNN